MGLVRLKQMDGVGAVLDQEHQRCFIEHADAEGVGLVQFASGFVASHHETGFLAHRSTHLAPCSFDQGLGLRPGERGQGAGEHEGLAAEVPLAVVAICQGLTGPMIASPGKLQEYSKSKIVLVSLLYSGSQVLKTYEY